MKKRFWKILNFVLAAVILAVSVGRLKLSTFAWLAASFIFLSIFINTIVGKRKRNVLSILFLVGYFGTIASISSFAIKLFVAIAAAFFFYLHETYDLKRRFLFEDFFELSSGFLLLTFVWSFSYFFSPHWWVVMILTFVFFSVFAFQMFLRWGVLAADAFLWALISALLMVEVSWTVLHLPVHFLTASVASFGVFYLLYQISLLYFTGTIAKNKIYFHAILITVAVILSLISSPWRP